MKRDESPNRNVGRQPRRGCASKPKVAVLGYLGTADRVASQPQRGFGPGAPRYTTNAAALGKFMRQDATPPGLGPTTNEVLDSTSSPRVAEYSNPGLKDATPSG